MFGEILKNLRLYHNYSQVKLAKDLYVSKQTISNWENNNITPSIDKLKDIAVYFSCSTDYLLELEGDKYAIITRNLTNEQIAHLQKIVHDYELLNSNIVISDNRDQNDAIKK